KIESQPLRGNGGSLDDLHPLQLLRLWDLVPFPSALPQFYQNGLRDPDFGEETWEPVHGSDAVEVQQRRGVADRLRHGRLPDRAARPPAGRPCTSQDSEGTPPWACRRAPRPVPTRVAPAHRA